MTKCFQEDHPNLSLLVCCGNHNLTTNIFLEVQTRVMARDVGTYRVNSLNVLVSCPVLQCKGVCSISVVRGGAGLGLNRTHVYGALA